MSYHREYSKERKPLWQWILASNLRLRYGNLNRVKILKLLREGKVKIENIVVNNPNRMYDEFEVRTLSFLN